MAVKVLAREFDLMMLPDDHFIVEASIDLIVVKLFGQ
jgi:hypothetical protein